MPSSNLFFKDRKTSDRIVWFLLIVIVVAVLFRFMCNKSKSASYKQQVEIAELLLKHVENNDTSAVFNIHGSDIDTFDVILGFKVLKSILSDKDFKQGTTEFVEYDEKDARLVDVVFHFENKSDEDKSRKLIVSFVKFTGSDKIYHFDITDPVLDIPVPVPR